MDRGPQEAAAEAAEAAGFEQGGRRDALKAEARAVYEWRSFVGRSGAAARWEPTAAHALPRSFGAAGLRDGPLFARLEADTLAASTAAEAPSISVCTHIRFTASQFEACKGKRGTWFAPQRFEALQSHCFAQSHSRISGTRFSSSPSVWKWRHGLKPALTASVAV